MKVSVCPTHLLWTIMIIFVLDWNPVLSLPESKDLLLTLKEKTALDKFKPQVMQLLPQKFMRSDFYLIRWLRAKHLDIPAAKTMLMDAVKWRKENNINSILQESFLDIQPDFHATFDTHDQADRPIVAMDVGEWDFRKAVLVGKSHRLNRYLTYIFERNVRNIFKAQETGKNVTRGIILVDLEGFTVQTHACPLCLPVLIRWTSTMEFYYPQFVNEIIVINAPTIVSIPLNALKPVMSADTREQLKVFGINK